MLSNVIKYDGFRPYKEYFHKSGIQDGQTMKMYGVMKNCMKCNSLFFSYKGVVFCSRSCSKIGKRSSEQHKRNIALSKMGSKNPAYSGGKMTAGGYRLILDRNHPNSNGAGYVMEHRLVMSKHIGRPLTKDEVVHHKNSDRSDNRIENLELMSKSDHASHHAKSTNRNWLYIKQKDISCPHCSQQINLEAVLKVY